MIEENLPRERRVMNPFWAAGALLVALLVSQGYSAYQLLGVRFRLAGMKAEAQATAIQLASAEGEVTRKAPDIRKDQQMAVDLSRLLVQVAQAGNKTAQSLVPAMRNDLNQLQLAIKIDAPAPAAQPAEESKSGPPVKSESK